MRHAAVLATAAWLWAGAAAALAQAPDEHAGHHPAGPAGATVSPPVEPPAPAGGEHDAHHPGGTAPGGAAGATAAAPGGMMGTMGMMGRPAKPLYPALMSLPDPTPQQRESLRAAARERLARGSVLLAQSQGHLQGALMAGNGTETALALRHAREALELLETGATMLRALDAGRSPPEIALQWFRGQLDLPTPAAGSRAEPGGGGPFGLSWLHLVSMAGLAALAIAMLSLLVGRARRAAALVHRLSAPAPTAPPPTPPAPAPAPVQTATVMPAAAAGERPAGSPTAPAMASPRSGRWSGTLRVAAIFPETPGVRTFRLTATDGGQIPFEFRPGQFLDLTVSLESGSVRRSYTIASAPTQRGYVEITVKREDAGTISRHLHDRVVVGDRLAVTAPAGALTFTGAEADSIVLIGGGVGITPLMSVIRYLTDRVWPGEITLIYCARTTENFIFRQELESLQRRHRNLQIVATMTRAEGAAWVGPQGHITRALIQQAAPDIAKRRVHLCGPPAMMEAVRGHLDALGVPGSQIRTEAFAASGAVASGSTPASPPGAAPTSPAVAPRVPVGPATATIRFALSGKTVPLPPDRTLLEVAEAAGVTIDNSCRAGTCGTCKVRLLDGSATMDVEDGLEPTDKAAGYVLACQTRSIGNLVVEA